MVPVVEMAPWKCTAPLTNWTAALLVPNTVLVQPLISVSAVVALLLSTNDAPSSDVKHCALLNVPPSA